MQTMPATMIWVHSRWALILHNDQKAHDSHDVRMKFLEQSPALHLNLFKWKDSELPVFVMNQDQTFTPFFGLVQQNDTELMIQVPGSNATWTVQIPSNPHRNVLSSDLTEPIIYSESFPGTEDVFMSGSPVIDPTLSDQPQVQEAAEPLGLILPTSANTLGDKDSIDNSAKFVSHTFQPADDLDDMSVSGPTGLFSSPTRPDTPSSISSLDDSFKDLSTECSNSTSSLVDDTDFSSLSGSEYAGPISAAVGSEFPKQLRSRTRQNKTRFTKPSARDAEAKRLAALPERVNRDELLLCGRTMGLSYRDIKKRSKVPDAESTLRGRYRAFMQRIEEIGAVLQLVDDDEPEPKRNNNGNNNLDNNLNNNGKGHARNTNVRNVNARNINRKRKR